MYKVGDLVTVASRTWPGINQPGGVGRITGVSSTSSSSTPTTTTIVPVPVIAETKNNDNNNNNNDNNNTQTLSVSSYRVSVRYVLDNRHEKEIDIQYISRYGIEWDNNTNCTIVPTADNTQYDEHTQQLQSQIQIQTQQSKSIFLRNRSLLLGRCQQCGSLRTDCGSCDLIMSFPTITTKTKPRPTTDTSNKKQQHSKRNQFTNYQPNNLVSSSSSLVEHSVLTTGLFTSDISATGSASDDENSEYDHNNRYNNEHTNNDNGNYDNKTITNNSDNSDSDSSTEDDNVNLVQFQQNQKRYQKFLRMKYQWEQRSSRRRKKLRHQQNNNTISKKDKMQKMNFINNKDRETTITTSTILPTNETKNLSMTTFDDMYSTSNTNTNTIKNCTAGEEIQNKSSNSSSDSGSGSGTESDDDETLQQLAKFCSQIETTTTSTTTGNARRRRQSQLFSKNKLRQQQSLNVGQKQKQQRNATRIDVDSQSVSSSSSSSSTTSLSLLNNVLNLSKKSINNKHSSTEKICQDKSVENVVSVSTFKKRKHHSSNNNNNNSHDRTAIPICSTPGSQDLSPPQKQHIHNNDTNNDLVSINDDASLVSASNSYIDDDDFDNDDNDMNSRYDRIVDTDIYYDNDDNDNFIQPNDDDDDKIDGMQLPSDMQDFTATVSFDQLGIFIDTICIELENDLIPDYKYQIFVLEQEFRKITSTSRPVQVPSSNDYPIAFNSLVTLETKCDDVRRQMIQKLRREKLDQGQLALNKLSNKKLYKQYKKLQMTKNINTSTQTVFRRLFDPRETQLDQQDNNVEELMHRIRQLCQRIRNKQELNDDHCDSNNSVDSGQSNNGWASPNPDSTQQMINLSSYNSNDDDQSMFSKSDHQSTIIDLHPYAQKKRKYRNSSFNNTDQENYNKKYRKHRRRRHRQEASTSSCRRNNDKESKRVRTLVDNNSSTIKIDKLQDQRKSRYAETDSIDSDDNAKLLDISLNEQNENVADHVTAEIMDCTRTNTSTGRNCSSRNNRNPLRERQGNHQINYSTNERISNRKPIAERMVQLLNSNQDLQASVHQNHTDNDDSDNVLDRNAAVRTTSRHRKRRTTQTEIHTRTQQQHPDVINEATTMPSPFTVLAQQGIDEATFLNTDSSMVETNITNICSLIEESFPKQSCIPLLRHLTTMLCLSSDDYTDTDKIIVFATFLELLRRNGCRTLQDLLSSNNSDFDSQVSLLSAIVHILAYKVNVGLTEVHGEVFAIFGSKQCRKLVDTIVCQCVDSVMSIFNPSAWGLDVGTRNLNHSLYELEYLRNALSKMYLPLERVSTCLLRELQCQHWYCVRDGEHAFVSAVDPMIWRQVVNNTFQSNTSTLSPPLSRLQSFGQSIPMCEIENMWNVLGFFAQTKSVIIDTEASRWNLLTKLLTSSSLPRLHSTTNLLPSETHLIHVRHDLGKLRLLLECGALGKLPRHDTFVIDLLRSAIHLEANAVESQEQARIKSYPTVSSKSFTRSRSLFRECKGRELIESNSIVIPCTGVATHSESTWLEQPLFIPSFTIIQEALGLVRIWSDLLFKELPARCHRFDSSLRAFARNLYTETSQSTHDSVEGQEATDPFDAAFKHCLGISKEGIGSDRKLLYLAESSAYLEIYASIPMILQYSKDDERSFSAGSELNKVCDLVWSLLSNNSMTARTDLLKTGCIELCSEKLFRDDPYRLYIMTKSLTFLSFLSIGVLPPVEDCIRFQSSIVQQNHKLHENLPALSTLLQCIVACMSCGGDSCRNMEIVAFIAGSLAIVLKSVVCLLQFNSHGFLTNFIASFKSTIIGNMLMAVEKCFKMVTSVSYCGLEEEICIQSLLSSLRWAIAITSHDVSAPQSDTRHEHVDENDDEFGEFDDSIFATIDIDDVMDSHHTPQWHPKSMFATLFDALEQSNPTIRFLLTEVPGGSLSVQGRSLVYRQATMISSCLAQLVATDFGDHCKMTTILNLPLVTSVENDTVSYKREIRHGFVKEFFHFAPRLALDQFIYTNSTCVVEVLVESLLDLQLLRRIPTCNLVRIKRIHGGEAEQEALTKLLKFNGTASSTVKREMEQSHQFACRVGHTLCQHSMDTDLPTNWIDSWNVSHNNQHQNWVCRLQPSVEREVFEVFRTLINMLDSSESGIRPIRYEQLARVVISTITSNLMTQYDRLHHLSLVMEKTSNNPYSYAKMLELFSTFFELLVTLISLILRSNEGRSSESLANFAIRFWKRFLSPIIRNETFCIRTKLLSICDSLSSDILESDTTKPEAASNMHQHIRSNSIPCLRAIFILCIDRRDNILNVDSVDVLNVVYAWATADANVMKVIPLLFSPSEVKFRSATDVYLTPSPFRREVHEYLSGIVDIPMILQHRLRLKDLKIRFYQDVILPRLSSNISTVQKNRTILLLQRMLEAESDDTIDVTMPTFDMRLICLFVRALSITLQRSLISPEVDDSSFCVIYSCLLTLSAMPATVLTTESKASLIKWLQGKVIVASTRDSLVSLSLVEKYLVNQLYWLHDVGNAILVSSVDDIRTFRQKLCDTAMRAETEDRRFPVWDVEIPQQSTKIISENCDNLQELELLMFPRSNLNRRNVFLNTYASKLLIPTSQQLKVWVPSRSVTRCLEKLITAYS